LTKGGESSRNELWYFTQSDLAAARIKDTKYILKYQPDGWLGETVSVNFPMLYNLRLDPFEKMGYSPNESLFAFKDYYTRNMWRFVYRPAKVAELAQSGVDYPPMQGAASMNLDAVKKQVAEAKHSIAD
jgi:hypothetical protein